MGGRPEEDCTGCEAHVGSLAEAFQCSQGLLPLLKSHLISCRHLADAMILSTPTCRLWTLSKTNDNSQPGGIPCTQRPGEARHSVKGSKHYLDQPKDADGEVCTYSE
jgi:hypothetical protein